MRWSPGGNLGPFLTACEYDWLDCPFAFAHYLWTEIVTDVADFLANETIVWRILIAVLLFATALHLVYWNLRWLREMQLGKDELRLVDLKVQDLELKLNILTYKVQYDAWPLPRFTTKNFRDESGNMRLAKFNDDSSWIKRIILNTRTESFDGRSIYDVRSRLPANNCTALELRPRIPAPIHEDVVRRRSDLGKKKSGDVAGGDVAWHPTSEEKNLAELGISRNHGKLGVNSIVSDSEMSKRNKSSSKKKTVRNSKTLKFNLDYGDDKSTEEKDNYLNKYQDAELNAKVHLEELPSSPSTNDTKTKSDTHETLYQVKEKLKNLHLTLRSYNLKESQAADLDDNQNLGNYNSVLDKNSSLPNECNDPTTVRDFIQSWNTYDYMSSLNTNSGTNTHDVNSQKHSSNNNVEFNQKERRKVKRKIEKSNVFTLAREFPRFKDDANKNVSVNSCVDEVNDYNKGDKQSLLRKNHPLAETTSSTVVSEVGPVQPTMTVPVRKSNSTDISTFKDELSHNIETSRNFNRSKIESVNKKIEFNKLSDLSCTEFRFQPKLLDIKEEPCESNFTVKSKSRFFRTNKRSSYQDKSSKENDNENSSSTAEIEESENEIEMKREEKNKRVELNKPVKFNSVIKNRNFNHGSKENSLLDEIKAMRNVSDVVPQQTFNLTSIKSEANCSTDSSSDTSVNRLIDRLIESERKRKSVDESSNAKFEKEFKVTSLNNIFSSHNFLDPVQFENDECDHFSIDLNTEKFDLENINDHEPIDNKKDEQITFVQNVSLDDCSASSKCTVIEKNVNELSDLKSEKKERYKKNEDFGFSEDFLKKSIVTLDIGQQNLEIQTDTNTSHSDAEPHYWKFQQTPEEDYKKTFSNELINEPIVNASKGVTKSPRDISENKNDNLSTGDKNLSNNNSTYQIFKIELGTADTNILNNNVIGDFNAANELYNQELLKEEISNEKLPRTVFTNTLPSGDATCLDTKSIILSSSPNKLEDSVLHELVDDTSSIMENIPKIRKHNSCDSIQKHLTKNNFEFDGKQIKAKSNINLTLNEKKAATLSCNKSKSYIMQQDIFTNVQNISVERKNSNQLLINSIKSINLSELDKESEIFEITQKNSDDSFNKLEKSENSMEPNSSAESMLSDKSSKSCIPVKNKLKAVKKDDTNLNLKNLSSLTSTASDGCKTVFKKEYKSESENESCKGSCKDYLISKTCSSEIEQKNSDDNQKTNSPTSINSEYENSTAHKQRAIMYVNIMTEDNQIISEVINPEQFLAYIKNREIEIPSAVKDKEFGIVVLNDQTVCQPNLDFEQPASTDSETKDENSMITLENHNVSINSSPVKVETEVLVKPCTKETSTSVSDLQNLKSTASEDQDKFKIFEIPEELTKEEYIKLLEIMNENPNF